MNKTFASLAAAAALSLGSSLAFAEAVVIAPEVGMSFHEHVTTEKVAPVTLQTELAVGGVVPAEVTLLPVPDAIIGSAPELKGHQYFVVGNRIHVVHPDTRALVTIID